MLDQPPARRTRFHRQLAGMIGVQRDVDGLFMALGQRPRERRADALGRGDGQPRMPAQHFDVRDRRERPGDYREPARRKRQRIAAGEHDLPDFRTGGDIIERAGEPGLVEPGRSRTDRFAPKAETAIDRADRDELQQHAIAIAVHQAGQGGLRRVADGIVEFGRPAIEFAGIGEELPRDRVRRIVRVDQRGQGRRHGERVALGHGLQLARAGRRGEASRDQVRGGRQGSRSGQGGRHGNSSAQRPPLRGA